MSDSTVDSLIWASSRSFSPRCLWRVRSWVRTARVRVRSRSSRTGFGGTNEARSMPRSASLASHTESSLSVLGRPGTFFTSRALTGQQSRPRASSRKK
jgi:hypothetical protein